jgi:glycosyltransferase involved in cell wall biosynthesis
MNSPAVSVIIPNYNHAPFLRERINSVLSQKFQDFELILLDDCSTDNSREVLKSYEGNSCVTHIVLNEVNTGNTFLQWERGIRLAQGEYIWVAESDDVANPEMLSVLIGELQKRPDAVVAYCHSQMIDSESRPMSFTWHKKGSDGNTYVYDGNWYLRHRMLVNNHIYNASMAVFRKAVFDLIPKSYQKYRYCGDWLFWNYVCSHGQVIEVCRVLNNYRQHENKVTASSQLDGRKWRDIAGILSEFADMLQLSSLQRRCLRGRWTKRFKKENGNSLPEIRREHPAVYGGSILDTVLYEVGKWFGFLKQS